MEQRRSHLNLVKKIIRFLALLLLAPAAAFAQSYPSPTYHQITLQTPLTAANGGTGVTSSTGSGSVVLSSAPTFTTSLSASTSNSSLAYAPATSWQQYGPGGGVTSLTDGLISQTNPGAHTSTNNSAFAVLSTVTGSGVNGPAAADEGFSVTAVKSSWPTSAVLGEVDGLSVITRNGQDDTCGICVNSGNVAGFSAILEGVDSQFAPTTGTVMNQVDVQLGAIETGLTGTAGSVGVIATAQAGTMGTGLLLQATGSATWTNAIMVNPNGTTGSTPGNASFLVLPTGQTTLKVNSGAALVVNGGGNSGVGADILLEGNGATTPNKDIRVLNGVLQVVNNAESTAILSLTDAGALTVTGSIKPSSTAGIIGTTAGDTANAGSIGEVISSDIPLGSAAALTTNTPANITSVSLTAGDWVCSGTAGFLQTSTTTLTSINAGTNTTSATLPPTEQGGYSSINTSFASGSAFANVLTVGEQIYNLTATTTVYLVGKAVFSASTESAYGKLSCTRFR